MNGYKNFQLAAYTHAEFLCKTDLEQVRHNIEYFLKYVPLKKVYLENHRGLFDVPQEKMRSIKALFEEYGIEASGGITSTVWIEGDEKNRIFDVFCFTDEKFRERYKQIVRDVASVFDEFILDDFFFTACRCEMCIEAKGERSWAEYRLDLMTKMAHMVVDTAKETNPACNCIIKYPNWYESYQETGYAPGTQKDIFDMIYTGTESRDPSYSQQHLQRYLSYSLMRYLENTAPGRNGGGWIDPGASSDNANIWLEQAWLTLFSKGRELMLFNFDSLADTFLIPPLGQQLERVDYLLSHCGNPVGTSVYEPFNACGEDQLMNYLGMAGMALEPTPTFNDKARTVFLAQSAAHDPDVMTKLEKFVREGGIGIVTSGFFRKMMGKGIEHMTSVRPTERTGTGQEFAIDSYYANRRAFAFGKTPVTYPVLDYKTNATWSEIEMISGNNNFPLMFNDFYGKGNLFIVNVPENFSDLYALPKEVITYMRKIFSRGQKVYLGTASKYNLFNYDNDVFCLLSYRHVNEVAEVVVRGTADTVLTDLLSGETFGPSFQNPPMVKRFDSAKTRDEEAEWVYRIPLSRGTFRFFKMSHG